MANGILPEGETFGIPNELLLRGPLGGLGGGILGNPLLDIGATIASLGGPVGARVAEGLRFQSARSGSQLRNLALLDQIRQRQQRQEAVSQLGGLLGQTSGISPSGQLAAAEEGLSPAISAIQTPEGRQQALGLISQIAPEAFAQGLLGQIFQTQEPTTLQRNVAAAFDPNVPEEQREALLRILEQDPQATANQLAAADLQLKAVKLQQELQELSQQRTEQRQAKGALIQSTVRDLNDAQRLAEINRELENTALQTGVPLTDIRRLAVSGTAALGDALGFDTSKSQRLVSLVDEFKKISSRFATSSAAKLFDQGNITNFQLQSIQEQTPSLSVAPEANRRVIADTVRIILDGADNAGVDIKDRGEFESLIQRLKGEEQPAQAPAQGPSVRKIEQMSLEEIRALPPVTELSRAAARAKIKRMRELVQ